MPSAFFASSTVSASFFINFSKIEITLSLAIIPLSSLLKTSIRISSVKTIESNPCLSRLIMSSVSFDAIKVGRTSFMDLAISSNMLK
jgi:hypothetical protein